MADLPGVYDPPAAADEEATALDRMVRPLRRAFRLLGLALLAVMIALPALQILLRQVGGFSFIGSGELTRFMLICVVFVTLPYVVSSGANIRMDEVAAMLPAGVRRWLRVVVTATGAAGFALAALSVAVATLKNLNNATPTLGIPYWIFFSAAFLGLVFASLECVIQFVKALRDREIYVAFAEEQPPEELPEL